MSSTILAGLAFLNAAEECATARAQNAEYIRKELPSLQVPDNLRSIADGICTTLLNEDSAIRAQIRSFAELLDTLPDEDAIAECANSIRDTLWRNLTDFHDLILDVRAEEAESNQLGLLLLLLTESAANILRAFNAVAENEIVADAPPVDDSGRSSEMPNDEVVVEEPYFDGDFFPIPSDESFLKYELLGFTRRLMAENVLDPATVNKLSKLMLGLERLPRTTSGLMCDLSLIARSGGNMDYYSLEISEERFAISTGGSVYDPEVGSDSHTSTLYECESTGFRDSPIDSWELGSWMLAALELLSSGGKIEVRDESEGELDWETLEEEPFDELDRRIRRWEAYLGNDD